MAMLTEIVKLELEEHNTKILCELGLIPPLLEMASADLKTKELVLTMLVKQRLFAAAGGVSLTLDIPILAKCSEIIEKLSSNGDGIKILVDVNGINSI